MPRHLLVEVPLTIGTHRLYSFAHLLRGQGQQLGEVIGHPFVEPEQFLLAQAERYAVADVEGQVLAFEQLDVLLGGCGVRRQALLAQPGHFRPDLFL